MGIISDEKENWRWIAEWYARGDKVWNTCDGSKGKTHSMRGAMEIARKEHEWSIALGFRFATRIRNLDTDQRILLS